MFFGVIASHLRRSIYDSIVAAQECLAPLLSKVRATTRLARRLADACRNSPKVTVSDRSSPRRQLVQLFTTFQAA